MLTSRLTHTFVAVAATATIALPAAAQAHTSSSSKTIVVTATRSAKPAAREAKATSTFSYTDQLRSAGEAIGHDVAKCSYSDPIYFTCQMTITLKGGSFKVSVPAHDSDTVTADIYGGTGRYSDASGQVTIASSSSHHAKYTIRFSA